MSKRIKQLSLCRVHARSWGGTSWLELISGNLAEPEFRWYICGSGQVYYSYNFLVWSLAARAADLDLSEGPILPQVISLLFLSQEVWGPELLPRMNLEGLRSGIGSS